MEPRKEVGSVVGYASAAQQHSRCYYCGSCWASSGTQCSVGFAVVHGTATAEKQTGYVEEGAEAGRREP